MTAEPNRSEQREGGSGQDDLLRSFGNRVRFLRTQRGWSLAEMALRYGGARSYLYQIERGTSSPTLNVMAALADAFGCNLSDLLDIESVTEGPWQQGYIAGQEAMRDRVLAAIPHPDEEELL